MRELIVTKSHRLIGAQMRFTLNQHKLLCLCIALVDQEEPARDANGNLIVEIGYDGIARLLKTTESLVNQWITEAAEVYKTVPIVLPPLTRGGETSSFCVAIDCEASSAEMKFIFRFHPLMDREILASYGSIDA